MMKVNRLTTSCGVFMLCAATAIAAQAQTFTMLLNFDGPDGSAPIALVQGVDGNFYGTTAGGGTNCGPYGCGTVFKITPEGALTTLYSFCSQPSCTDGIYPYAGLVQATDGNFYGTTSQGGSNIHAGTVFKITPAGNFTTVYSFCTQTDCSDGNSPTGGLIQGTDGSLYGTTFTGGTGGAQYCESGCGTVFKISPNGTFTSLHQFTGYSFEGSGPDAGLVQGKNGNFYGTTKYGGAYDQCPLGYGCGTVFEITPSGRLTTLHSFAGHPGDGATPYAGLVLTADGTLFGTTSSGGANDQGTAFKVTPAGDLQTIYNFCSQPNCSDGVMPEAALVWATDGNLYGVTPEGGAYGPGLIFKMTPAGTLTPLYSYCPQGYPQCPDGNFPLGLVQATNGIFYGTTDEGGDLFCGPPYGCGTVFSLSVNLGSFVKTLPPAAKIGAEVGILGTDLTGTSSVRFNGVAAQFTVKTPTLILTRVPSRTTTGYVTVTTRSGVLKSNLPFLVIP